MPMLPRSAKASIARPLVLAASLGALLAPAAGRSDNRADAPEAPPARGGGVLARMDRHAGDMSALLLSVVRLEYAEAARQADDIAAAPLRAAGEAGDGKEAKLPAAFLALQDTLRRQAKVLAGAARARNGKALGRAFGQLTETCVACHLTYRGERGARDPAP